jgi:hypothetical protein
MNKPENWQAGLKFKYVLFDGNHELLGGFTTEADVDVFAHEMFMKEDFIPFVFELQEDGTYKEVDWMEE